MGFWQDFKGFAMRGNVIDLAVGVIIGGAFGKIVTALVDDLVMPFIGMLTGSGQKFTDHYLVLKYAKPGDVYASLEEARKAGANVFAYGHFMQTIVDFLIIAFFIFLAIRLISKFRAKEEAKEEAKAPPGPSSTDKLLMEIRDLLQKKG